MVPTEPSNALARMDPVMASLLRRHGPIRLGRRPAVGDRFAVLARSVAYQQLAGAAASTIWSRVLGSLEESRLDVDPRGVLNLGEDRLRQAGLSGSKAGTLLELAEACESGSVRLGAMGRMDDEDVIATLSGIRGIGRWTAQMFLMAGLHRIDVWPSGDLGVRNGLGIIFGMDVVPDERTAAKMGDPYTPYRSVLAWWCWREVDAER